MRREDLPRRSGGERKRKCYAIFSNGEYPIRKNRITPFRVEDGENSGDPFLIRSSSRSSVAEFFAQGISLRDKCRNIFCLSPLPSPYLRGKSSLAFGGARGSILILALWVIFMLALLAVAVGAYVDSRLTLARRLEQRLLAETAARTGIARSLILLKQDTNGWDSVSEPWADSRKDFSNVVCGAAVFSVCYEVDLSGGGRGTNYGVGDEQSRIDLNLARVELLTTLMQEVGGMGAEAATRVAAALHTASTKPVENLPGVGEKTGWQDSRFKRGPFRSVGEIRWVTGMTEEAFLKIRDHVTVHGGARVNLNTAGLGVLRTLAKRAGSGDSGSAGVESLAKKILQFRERGGIFKSYLGSGLVEALGPGAGLTGDERSRLYGMTPFITVASDHFRGWAQGAPVNRAGETRRFDFVWDRKHHKIEFWHED
jgi:type II secretory pathway component PulK